jgi:hypothetical protein
MIRHLQFKNFSILEFITYKKGVSKISLRVHHHHQVMTYVYYYVIIRKLLNSISLHNGSQNHHAKDLIEHAGLLFCEVAGTMYPHRCFPHHIAVWTSSGYIYCMMTLMLNLETQTILVFSVLLYVLDTVIENYWIWLLFF